MLLCSFYNSFILILYWQHVVAFNKQESSFIEIFIRERNLTAFGNTNNKVYIRNEIDRKLYGIDLFQIIFRRKVEFENWVAFFGFLFRGFQRNHVAFSLGFILVNSVKTWKSPLLTFLVCTNVRNKDPTYFSNKKSIKSKKLPSLSEKLLCKLFDTESWSLSATDFQKKVLLKRHVSFDVIIIIFIASCFSEWKNFFV